MCYNIVKYKVINIFKVICFMNNNLKQKIFKSGEESLTQREILALYLSFVAKESSKCLDILMEKFGSLEVIFNCDVENLMQIKDMNIRTAIFIKLTGNLIKIRNEEKLLIRENRIIKEDIPNLIKNKFLGISKEKILLILLSKDMRIKYLTFISEGNLNSVEINIKSILNKALINDAKYVILAHNHPSGNVTPSKNDLIVTQKFFDICKAVEINFMDHYIVAEDSILSLKESGVCKF